LEELRSAGYADSCFFGYDAVAAPGDISRFGVTPVSLPEGFKDADAVIIMNNHKSHRLLDIFTLLMTTKKPCLFVDGWRVFDPRDIKQIDHVTYLGVGCK
jgi:UDP-N-acetyl-D-mannosaminuronic acid dehydrogenase